MYVQSLRIFGLKSVLALFIALFAMPALAQTFPPLTGRVVDAAKILSAEQVAALDSKLQALEVASGHQLVVATVPSLQDYPIEDYGYKLLRAWGIGKKDVNDGVILLVAPTERKVRIEVGYGLEPVLTDAYSGIIITDKIVPRFKADDYPGGISAGVDAIAEQIKLPPEQAQARMNAAAAADIEASNKWYNDPDYPVYLIFPAILIFIFFALPVFRAVRGGVRRGRSGGIGQVILWSALDAAMRGGSGGGSNWGGGGGFGGGGGGGGFSGGGGSSGGGGASGGW